jgi:GNAT superfamily N-acetyltransferase
LSALPSAPVLRVEVDHHPSPDDLELIDRELVAWTLAHAGDGDLVALAVLARDDVGHLVGGIHGFTWSRCCELVSLWVDEAARDRGLGTALLREAECEAVRRGCTQAMLFTYAIQAPELYVRAGYEVIGVLDGYPIGSAALWFRKRLA